MDQTEQTVGSHGNVEPVFFSGPCLPEPTLVLPRVLSPPYKGSLMVLVNHQFFCLVFGLGFFIVFVGSGGAGD